MSVWLASAPAQASAAFRWPQGKAAVSLTYDDGLDSQLDGALPQLDAAGLKATFFVTQENMEARLADWEAVGRRGHEIANHTVNHPCDLQRFNPDQFARVQIDGMERFLAANFGADRPRTFAYPCDVTNLGKGSPNVQLRRYKAMLSKRGFLAARTSEGEPNDPHWARRHPYWLQANAGTYDRDDPQIAIDYIDRAVRRGAWAILVFHEVLEHRKGLGDTSLATHAAIIQAIAQRPLWCAPLGRVFESLPTG